jgi:glycosyltransferase involved in cell wall biosynthesis
MNFLFLHPNMPGQYKLLARFCAASRDNRVVFLTEPGKPDIPGIHKVEYSVPRKMPRQFVERLSALNLVKFSKNIMASQNARESCRNLKNTGFVPDIIIGHLGWGSGLFLKDVFPDTPVLNYADFFFAPYGADLTFLNNRELSDHDRARRRIINSAALFALTESDWCITSTLYQRNAHPDVFHPKISVLHDGIDTDNVVPDPDAVFRLPNGKVLSRADEVITYISPVFEPHRGFPQFMEAVDILLKERPQCHVVVVGKKDGSGYGLQTNPNGPSYLQEMLSLFRPDKNRFHLTGPLSHDRMVKVMQVSSAHIYLTIPFVLSWSMLEAMAAGCVVIGSDTEPVQEVITHGNNGLLARFFSPEDIAASVAYALDNREAMEDIRRNARQTILDRYAFKTVLPLHLGLINDLAAGRIPPPTSEAIRSLHKKPLQPD